MHELNINGKSEHAVNVIKRIINKLVGKMSMSSVISAGENGERATYAQDEND